MQINISFNLINLLGTAVFALVAGYAGNIVGLLASIPLNRKRASDERFWSFAAGLAAMTAMTPIKIVIALIATAVSTYASNTTTGACLGACIATGVIGMLFTLLTLTGRN